MRYLNKDIFEMEANFLLVNISWVHKGYVYLNLLELFKQFV